MPPKKKSKVDARKKQISLDLLQIFDHNPALHNHILAFASVEDLCSLDLVCRVFKDYTGPSWEEIAFRTFGLSGGKDGWRKGVKFLRPPVFFALADKGVHGADYTFAGTAHISCNENIIAIVSDDTQYLDKIMFPLVDDNGAECRSPIALRDARTLNFIRSMPTPMESNWQVAICGKQGAEVIVTSQIGRIMAFQGNRMMELLGFDFLNNGLDIPILGCETQLIVIDRKGGNILVFRVGTDPLLAHFKTIVIPGQICSSPRWVPSNQFSVVSRNQESKHTIHVMTSEIETVKEIHGIDLDVQECAVGERFIAVCDEKKKIHIFELHSGIKLYSSLCDVIEDDQLDNEDDLIYPLSMEPVGDLLVSTSHLGHALCIWNMKSGHLLRRYNFAFEQRQSQEIPDGMDVTSMIRLKHLPAFVTMAECAFVWAFPDNTKHSITIASIRRREKWNYDHGFYSDESDSNDEN